MDLSPMWVVPLAVGAAGAIASVLWARALGRDVDQLQAALRPLRATRVGRSR